MLSNLNINPPSRLFIELTTECNLRCKHCHMWMSKEDRSLSLSTKEKELLIKEFHKINPNGSVIFTGGETMLKEDEFFSLSKLCRTLNLTSIANTNGSLINNKNNERLLLEGPSILIISLDSHQSDIHNYIRGVKGCFTQVVESIKGIMELKKSLPAYSNTKIFTNTVLFEKNISECEDYIEFARNELTIDGVLFQCLINTYKNQSEKDPFFEKNFFKDPEKAIKKIDSLIESYSNDSFLVTNSNDFKWIKKYVSQANADGLTEQICDSHQRNIIIDQYGNYQLCFNMEELEGIKELGNCKDLSLSAFWSSSNSADARVIMDKCRKGCGVLNCHRKENNF